MRVTTPAPHSVVNSAPHPRPGFPLPRGWEGLSTEGDESEIPTCSIETKKRVSLLTVAVRGARKHGERVENCTIVKSLLVKVSLLPVCSEGAGPSRLPLQQQWAAWWGAQGPGVHSELLRPLIASLLEGVDSLTSHLQGGKSAWTYFCTGGLPVAKGVTHVSASSVHCAPAIWTTQGRVFLGRAGGGGAADTPQPQGSYQMAECLFALDDSEQPSGPSKASLVSSSAPSFPLSWLGGRQWRLPLKG